MQESNISIVPYPILKNNSNKIVESIEVVDDYDNNYNLIYPILNQLTENT